ncbi:hypothetical protein ACVW0I_001749 [Bradyrhizobium sp. LM6.11]
MNVNLENGTALLGRISSLSAPAAFVFSDSTEHLASPWALEARLHGRLWSKLPLAAVLLSVGKLSGRLLKGSFHMPDISEAIAELTDRLIASERFAPSSTGEATFRLSA